MPNFSGVALSSSGRPIAGATISVFTTSADGISTGTLAALFSDQNLAVLQTNPFNCDGIGNFSFWVTVPGTYAVQISGTGITTQSFTVVVAANGPVNVAVFNATAQQANIGLTLLYAVPANGGGLYRVSAFTVITQAATNSSTLPAVNVSSTFSDTSGVSSTAFTVASTANLVGFAPNTANAPGTVVIDAKAGTNINISTVGYLSSGATPMQYAIHVRLEYLG